MTRSPLQTSNTYKRVQLICPRPKLVLVWSAANRPTVDSINPRQFSASVKFKTWGRTDFVIESNDKTLLTLHQKNGGIWGSGECTGQNFSVFLLLNWTFSCFFKLNFQPEKRIKVFHLLSLSAVRWVGFQRGVVKKKDLFFCNFCPHQMMSKLVGMNPSFMIIFCHSNMIYRY